MFSEHRDTETLRTIKLCVSVSLCPMYKQPIVATFYYFTKVSDMEF